MPFLCPKLVQLVGALLILLMIVGCAAQPRSPIANTAFKGPTLEAVRANPESFIGSKVRWGGTITRVENRREETWIEIVEQPLNNAGRPSSATASEGRFIARIPGFLDPAIYAQGRQLTVIGTLENSVQRNIGEYPYDFPVVAVDTYQLWEERKEPEVIYYYSDPFRGYPYRPWSWYPYW